MRRSVASLLGGVAMTLALAVDARSTTVERLEPQDLVARAERITWGDVVSSSAARDASGRIFTEVEVVAREMLKGEGTSVHLKLPGGEVDGVVSVFHGMPRFAAGEEVVLHVSGENERSHVRVPVGLGQGVHRVLRPGRGEAIATRDTRDLTLVAPGLRGAGSPGQRDEVPLEALLARIRAEVSRQAAERGR